MNESNDILEAFDFERHRIQAVDKYQKIYPLYEEFSEVIKNILFEAFNTHRIKLHSIEARAKTIDSFGEKVATPSLDDPDSPRYPDPLNEITDLAGVRVITFLPRTLDDADKTIRSEFEILEKSDKAEILIKEERFGYGSVHYLVRLEENRTALPEYDRFKSLIAEIQVRTILQHAWAEIEHDIQYKTVDTIPNSIRRRFMSLAGMLEIADREFQAIQDDDVRLRRQARKSVREGKLEHVEITPDALKTYLDRKLGSDRRMKEWAYEFLARTLRRMGFSTFKQIEECTQGYDGDQLGRILWGTRQGQITRFEMELLAGMGENYIEKHLWAGDAWFRDKWREKLEHFRKAKVKVGSYAPHSSASLQVDL